MWYTDLDVFAPWLFDRSDRDQQQWNTRRDATQQAKCDMLKSESWGGLLLREWELQYKYIDPDMSPCLSTIMTSDQAFLYKYGYNEAD